jgi:Subtilase family
MRRESPRSVWSLAAAFIVVFSAAGIAATPGPLSVDWQSRVTPRVQQVLNSALGSNSSPSKTAGSSSRYDSKNRLQIDIEFDCAHPAPTGSLIAAGMVIGTTVNVPPMCVVEGWAPTSSIAALASVPDVKKVDLPKYPRSHPPLSHRSGLIGIGAATTSATNGTPAINGNGVAIMNADKYVQQTGKNGASITIGVISDDAADLAAIQGRGELPPSINVVTPSANPTSHATLTDEGTMMLEEVYAVAPGANLAFCGPGSATEYFACVTNLIAAGATVISDDIVFFGFDVMSGSTQNAAGQALANLLTANPKVMLYHSAGNDAQDYWQGAYTAVSSPAGGVCAPGGQAPKTDNFFEQFGANKYLTWHTRGGNTLLLASALPSGQTAPSNIDLYVYNPTTAQVITCATASSGGTVGSTSYNIIDGSAIPSGTYQILIGTQDASLSGTFLKLIGMGDGADTFSPITAGAPTSPQAFASGVVLVGAVYGNDGIGNAIEQYSDTGPIQIEVPAPSTLQAPHLVAPDGVFVDTNGTQFTASGGLFFGTSAASPNAAAVAVLLRSAFPTLTPAQVTTFMQVGAAQLGASSPNATFGYGRVDALGALAAIPGPTLSGLQGTSVVGGGAPPVVPFTVGGTGALGVSTASSVTMTSSGSASVAISPSTCGNPTTSCTLAITPATGSYGTANIQVVVKDGANRALSSPVAVVVTKPAPPAISLTSGATQSVLVNSAIAPVMFTLSGTGALVVTPNIRNISGLTITSGCGTTTMTCTATLGTASSTAGTATLAITVQDVYVQTASATATVTETVPPKSGGGGMDRWTLLVLCCLILGHVGRKTFARAQREIRITEAGR